MIIKSLVLHNFGVYAGTNKFAFSSKKPVVLIGGLNGRGKTTFLEAVLLALYGANSFAYKESSNNSYNKYIRSFVNVNDGTLESFVELEFVLSEATDEIYNIRREWNAQTPRSKEKIFVKKNGIEDAFLTNNWNMVVENILPSALANFFFFDGEKISELAVDSSNEQIKNSIRSLLGIAVLDVLKKDIHRNSTRLQKMDVHNEYISHLQKVEISKAEAASKLKAIDESIEEYSSKIIELEEVLSELEQEYLKMGGKATEKKEEYIKKRAEGNALLEQNKQQIINFAGGNFPFNLIRDLLEDVYASAKLEFENTAAIKTANRVKSFFDENKDKFSDIKAIEEFIAHFQKSCEKGGIPSQYDLGEQTIYQIKRLLDRELDEGRKEIEELLSEQANIKNAIDEVEGYLSLDVNEKELQDIKNRIEKAKTDKIQIETKLNSIEQERAPINGELIKSTAEFNRCVEKVLESMELTDDINRTERYSIIAEKIITEFEIRLQRQKAKILSDTITECYKTLSNKKKMIKRIEMDPETLDLTYFDGASREVRKESLSAGEKQLMVISILWALAKNSNRKLPVIIDTPLSRLDSNHREAMIKKYFPNASDQTIILSTDSEINQYYYRMMQRNVGDEFTLEYDEETKSTSIKQGYFSEG